MCRLLIYKGPELKMSEVITEAERSLIHQSYDARERAEPLNGDGFGVGWYDLETDPTPGAFTSITPAWSNRNLRRLAGHIRSSCFFAHVRAASPGLPVTELNCHPFMEGRFLWMHNGSLPRFDQVERRLRASLSDAAYHTVEGSTDSEHAFALFLDLLRPKLDSYDSHDLAGCLIETIRALERLRTEADIDEPGMYNLAVTDGHTVAVSRYASAGTPQSLYCCHGRELEVSAGRCRMIPGEVPEAVLVASEPLTEEHTGWEPVPPGEVLLITPEMHLIGKPIEL